MPRKSPVECWNSLKFEVIHDGWQYHVERDDVRNVIKNRARWLPHWVDRVNDGMSDSGDADDSEQPTGNAYMGLG